MNAPKSMTFHGLSSDPLGMGPVIPMESTPRVESIEVTPQAPAQVLTWTQRVDNYRTYEAGRYRAPVSPVPGTTYGEADESALASPALTLAPQQFTVTHGDTSQSQDNVNPATPAVWIPGAPFPGRWDDVNLMRADAARESAPVVHSNNPAGVPVVPTVPFCPNYGKTTGSSVTGPGSIARVQALREAKSSDRRALARDILACSSHKSRRGRKSRKHGRRARQVAYLLLKRGDATT